MGMESPDTRPSWADDSCYGGAAKPRRGGSNFQPANGGFFVAPRCKGNQMDTPSRHLRELLQLIGDNGFTVSILSAVVVVCFFAFGLGADHELVGGLLILGLITAVVEARLHAKNQR
jgi:hypothetical protein